MYHKDPTCLCPSLSLRTLRPASRASERRKCVQLLREAFEKTELSTPAFPTTTLRERPQGNTAMQENRGHVSGLSFRVKRVCIPVYCVATDNVFRQADLFSSSYTVMPPTPAATSWTAVTTRPAAWRQRRSGLLPRPLQGVRPRGLLGSCAPRSRRQGRLF